MDVAPGVLVAAILAAHLAVAAWVTVRTGWGQTPDGTRRPLPLGVIVLVLMSAIGLLQVIHILRGW
jgi:hypothetical protein